MSKPPEPSATRVELERAVRRLVGDTSKLSDGAGRAAKRTAPALGALAALLAFFWGRRRGRRRSVDVQITQR